MILKSIAKKYPDAVSSKCCENKCSLVVSKRGDIIILKGERVSKEKPAKRVCDCLIFQNNSVALVELKSGSIDVGKVKEKLENGGRIVTSIFESIGHSSNYRIFPILLAKRYSNRFVYRKLRTQKVRLGNKEYSILCHKCGCSLDRLIGT